MENKQTFQEKTSQLQEQDLRSDDSPNKARKVPIKQQRKANKKFWSVEEDRILSKAVQKYGPKRWSKISKMLENREPKRCRERWFNYLSGNRHDWNRQDEWDLFLLHKFLGNKWAEIAKHLKRGDNQIKNKMTCMKRKGLAAFEKKQNSLKHRLSEVKKEIESQRRAQITESEAAETVFSRQFPFEVSSAHRIQNEAQGQEILNEQVQNQNLSNGGLNEAYPAAYVPTEMAGIIFCPINPFWVQHYFC